MSLNLFSSSKVFTTQHHVPVEMNGPGLESHGHQLEVVADRNAGGLTWRRTWRTNNNKIWHAGSLSFEAVLWFRIRLDSELFVSDQDPCKNEKKSAK